MGLRLARRTWSEFAFRITDAGEKSGFCRSSDSVTCAWHRDKFCYFWRCRSGSVSLSALSPAWKPLWRVGTQGEPKRRANACLSRGLLRLAGAISCLRTTLGVFKLADESDERGGSTSS